MGDPWGIGCFGVSSPEALIRQKKEIGRKSLKIGEKKTDFFLLEMMRITLEMTVNTFKKQKMHVESLKSAQPNPDFTQFHGVLSRFLTFNGVSQSSQCVLNHFQ